MAQSPLEDVIAHWHKPYENFQTSSLDFYTAVEAALERRQIPGVKTSQVDWQEGGILAAKREYLRAEREKLVFDICAAPFGTGFFFSWWLGEKRPSLARALAVLLIVLVVSGIATNVIFSILSRIPALYFLARTLALVLWPLTMVAVLVGVFVLSRTITRKLGLDMDDLVLAIPILGPVYRWLFKPETYYRIDTTLMFQSMVHSAVVEVIDGLMTAKGLRALSDEEKKPIMKDFLKR